MISHSLHCGGGHRPSSSRSGNGFAAPPSSRVVHEALRPECDLATALVVATDWLEQGFVLVDAESRIRFASGPAQRLLSGGRALTDASGLLRARSPADTAKLRHLVQRCAQRRARGEGPAAPIPCRIGEPPLFLLIVPLVVSVRPSSGADGGDDDAAALVFIIDPEDATAPTEEQLRQFFGFTLTESVFARRLMSGMGLRSCAADLGMSVETARTHLRHVFAKTGARRQAELVRLLLTARHPVRPPGDR